MFCPACGSKNPAGQVVCIQCGKRLPPKPDIRKGKQTLTGKVRRLAGYFAAPAWYTHAFILEIEDDLKVPCEQSQPATELQEDVFKIGDILTVQGKVRRFDDPYESFKKRFIVVGVNRIRNLSTRHQWRGRGGLERLPLLPICLAVWEEKNYFTALQLLNCELFELRNYLIQAPAKQMQLGRNFLEPILAGIQRIEECIDEVAEEMASADGLSLEVPEELKYSSVADYVIDMTGWPRWSVERAMGGSWPFPQKLAPRKYRTVLDFLIAANLQSLVWKYLPQNYLEILNTSFLAGWGSSFEVRPLNDNLMEIKEDSGERILFAPNLCLQVLEGAREVVSKKKQKGCLIAVDASERDFTEAVNVLKPFRTGVAVIKGRLLSDRKLLPSLEFGNYLKWYWKLEF